MAERVLVVDDHPLTRDALASLLAQDGFDVVGEAADGDEALEPRREAPARPRAARPLDARARRPRALPGLREAAPGCEVVVLTASGTEENLLAAIRGGAAGYLLKSEPPERIVDFLRGVANGEAALSGSVGAAAARAGARRRPLDGGVPDEIAQRALGAARSRCCSCSTSTSRPTRSRSACSSPSTPCGRT